MRQSWSSSNMCIICSNNALLVSCLSCNEIHHCFLEWPNADSTASTAQPVKDLPNADGTASTDQPEKDLQEECRSPPDAISEAAVGCCISSCQQHIAAITADKRLLVWSRQEGKKSPNCITSYKFLISWTLVKRPVDLVFDADSTHILVADKTGDVLRFSLRPEDGLATSPLPAQTSQLAAADDEESAGSPAPVLLGHLSMLLTLTMSPCGRFVATGDRDEKVRVSHYPRAHNIASFCLGHSEFVAQLRTLPSRPHAMLSASGDGSLRIWNFETGEELSVTDTHTESDQFRQDFEDSCLQSPSKEAGINSHEQKSDSTKPPAESKSLLDCASSDDPNQEVDARSSSPLPQQSGRDRVVPRQCAVTCIAVATETIYSNSSGHSNNENAKSDQGQNNSLSTTDLVAVCFARSRSLSLYGLSADNGLRHLYTAQLPAPAATLTWLDWQTLVVLCPPRETSEENEEQTNSVPDLTKEPTPLLVWRWSGEDLALVPGHSLSKFSAQNAHRLKASVPDATVLFKQRFDNVAEYQKKKQSRLQQKQQEQLSCKRIKLTNEETECR